MEQWSSAHNDLLLFVVSTVVAFPFTLFFSYVSLLGVWKTLKSIRTAVLKSSCVIATLVAIFGITYYYFTFDPSLNNLYRPEIPPTQIFSLHATSSHTLCLVLGVVTGQWVRTNNSLSFISKALITIILLSKFFIGGFIWYKFFFSYILNMQVGTVTTAQACSLALSHTISFLVGKIMLHDYYQRGFDRKGSEASLLQYYTICGATLVCFPRAWTVIHNWTGSDITNPLLSPCLWSFLSMFLFSFMSVNRLRYYFLLLLAIAVVSFSQQESAPILQGPPTLGTAVVKFFEEDRLLKFVCSLFVGVFLIALGAESGVLISTLHKGSRFRSQSTKQPSGKAARKARLQRAKAFPPPFPNGWFRLLNSEEVQVGESKHVTACGHDFAVFRGENGKVVVLDAFCPHLGANIAHGTVKGNLLECPFHGWSFDEDGKCQHVPYCSSIPSVAKTRSWTVKEYAKMICVFFHAEGEEPDYHPIPLPEIDEGLFVDQGMWNEDVHMHIQDFAENAADYAHFNFLHDNMGLPFGLNRFFYLTHDINWFVGLPGDEDPKSHSQFSHFVDIAAVHCTLFPRPLPRIVESIVVFNGPGSIVYFRFCVKGLGDIVLIKTFLPTGNLKVRVQDRYFAHPRIPHLLAKFICGQALYAFKDDIAVWEKKSYSRTPVILRGDGPMHKVRRWYSQFYTEQSKGSPTLDW